ncbi:MAG: hypothetical protein ACREBK_06440 [Sphingomicrobium sp.]
MIGATALKGRFHPKFMTASAREASSGFACVAEEKCAASSNKRAGHAAAPNPFQKEMNQ